MAGEAEERWKVGGSERREWWKLVGNEWAEGGGKGVKGGCARARKRALSLCITRGCGAGVRGESSRLRCH